MGNFSDSREKKAVFFFKLISKFEAIFFKFLKNSREIKFFVKFFFILEIEYFEFDFMFIKDTINSFYEHIVHKV